MTVHSLNKNTVDGEKLIHSTVKNHVSVVETFFTRVATDLDKLSDLFVDTLQNGNKLIFCGNGGSAADSQHMAAEFVGRFLEDRKALPAISLTTDTSALTAIANDYGYDQVFSRQLEGLGTKGDVFMGITTSGNSENILKAFEVAKEKGITTIVLTGKSGGAAKEMADFEFTVDSDYTPHIQECHIMFLHLLCSLVEQKMGLVESTQETTTKAETKVS
jgi:D-sedoheptulose 7-phosphate isomerase